MSSYHETATEPGAKGAGNAIVPRVAAEFIKAYSVDIETPEETTARMARTTI